MQKSILKSIVLLIVIVLWPIKVQPAEIAQPFGFQIGKTSYEQTLKNLHARNWKYLEYDKKQFHPIESRSPLTGKNTFLKVKPEGLEGAKGLLFFFSGDSVLDAVIVQLDTRLFEDVMNELDSKYDLVKKNLVERSAYSPYPYVLWQSGKINVELQKLSRFRLRAIYVDKLLYENYRDFLYEKREIFWPTVPRPKWIQEL